MAGEVRPKRQRPGSGGGRQEGGRGGGGRTRSEGGGRGESRERRRGDGDDEGEEGKSKGKDSKAKEPQGCLSVIKKLFPRWLVDGVLWEVFENGGKFLTHLLPAPIMVLLTLAMVIGVPVALFFLLRGLWSNWWPYIVLAIVLFIAWKSRGPLMAWRAKMSESTDVERDVDTDTEDNS
jgi:hypothetical protein